MELKKVSEFVWEISKHGKMLVPAVVFASYQLMEKIKQDNTLQQAANVACLPGIIKAAYTMPDAHQGYGFPIGGVAAFDLNEGIISPGGVGYDINCGVRLLRTDFQLNEILDKRKSLLDELFKEIPVGVGKKGITKISKDELNEILVNGMEWAIKHGYGKKEDLQRVEEFGKIKGADPEKVSSKAMQRGLPQIGTLGSGNHFLEIQKVDKIYDEKTAKAFGINNADQITVMIHSGSRGLGHQIASDYIKSMEDKFGYSHLPDRELICAPINSDQGQDYNEAMRCGVNFAFTNRQLMAHLVRESFKKVIGTNDGMDVVYDVCHNIAKFEKHKINEESREVCIHRKGATRSFGPGREEIPDIYRKIGQPIMIPGSMGTASYLLVGTSTAEETSFGSTAHGAGRVKSRHASLKEWRGDVLKKKLKDEQDIDIMALSMRGLAEEAPNAYKDVDEVVRVSDGLGIGKKVARLVPIGVMKG